jgi:prepilin-type N-terminal cleavage/methylation domain-containing protein
MVKGVFVNKTKKNIAKFGFTLFELLLAISLVALVGAGIYKSFTLGMSLYRWAGLNKIDSSVLMFFDKISDDLKNCYDDSNDEFIGFPETCLFSVHNTEYLLVSRENIFSLDKDANPPCKKIEYKYDKKNKQIIRDEYKKDASVPFARNAILDKVERFGFRYLVYDKKEKTYLFCPVTEDSMPVAVEIYVELTKDTGKAAVYRDVIDIPFKIMSFDFLAGIKE